MPMGAEELIDGPEYCGAEVEDIMQVLLLSPCSLKSMFLAPIRPSLNIQMKSRTRSSRFVDGVLIFTRELF